jgi:hypothetical protein
MASQHVYIELPHDLVIGRDFDGSGEAEPRASDQGVEAPFALQKLVDKRRHRVSGCNIKRMMEPRFRFAKSPASTMYDAYSGQAIRHRFADPRGGAGNSDHVSSSTAAEHRRHVIHGGS